MDNEDFERRMAMLDDDAPEIEFVAGEEDWNRERVHQLREIRTERRWDRINREIMRVK